MEDTEVADDTAAASSSGMRSAAQAERETVFESNGG